MSCKKGIYTIFQRIFFKMWKTPGKEEEEFLMSCSFIAPLRDAPLSRANLFHMFMYIYCFTELEKALDLLFFHFAVLISLIARDLSSVQNKNFFSQHAFEYSSQPNKGETYRVWMIKAIDSWGIFWLLVY